MARLRGLPASKQMRHDAHFVDRFSSRATPTLGLLVPVDQIDPNPDQPRRQFDDIDQLVASIQNRGVLEPLLVRRSENRFQIIAGERRFRAAQKAGLSRIPCIELDVDEEGCLEISLVENLQRRDLLPFEEADALQQLRQRFGFKHEELARKLSRSRTSITEALSLSTIPAVIRTLCQKAHITSRSVLLQLARLKDEAEMRAVITAIKEGNLNRDQVRALARDDPRSSAPPHTAPPKERSTGFVFRFSPPNTPCALTLRFTHRKQVRKKELIKVLESILQELRATE